MVGLVDPGAEAQPVSSIVEGRHWLAAAFDSAVIGKEKVVGVGFEFREVVEGDGFGAFTGDSGFGVGGPGRGVGDACFIKSDGLADGVFEADFVSKGKGERCFEWDV